VINRSRDWGIDVQGASFDFARVQQRKNRVVDALRKGMQDLAGDSGVEVVSGRGRLTGRDEVEVALPGGGVRSLKAGRVIIATGSYPTSPAALHVDGHRVITSDHALGLESIPKSIIIIGGGYIGCEFGYLFNEFGAEVTIVEGLGQLLNNIDADIGNALAKEFTRSGIRVITGRPVDDLEKDGDGVSVHVAGETLRAEKAMVCAGRAPNTGNLGLEEAGINTDPRGFIEIDGHCRASGRTSEPDIYIYAAGDVTNRGQLANVAHRQGVVAVESALGLDSVVDYRVIPYCVFTQPEVAAVGIAEREAKEAGLDVRAEMIEFRQLGKAWVSADTGGIMKLTIETSSNKVLGVCILGPYASFLIGEAALAVKAGMSLEDLAGSMPVHPTFSEAIVEVARKALESRRTRDSKKIQDRENL
jgi:dihydrolipoamide dehydrogenase